MNKHGITIQNYYSDFVMVLSKTGADILSSIAGIPVQTIVGNPFYKIPTEKMHIWHMATGVSGEAFEFLESVVNGVEGTEKEELSDMLFYAVGLAKFLPEGLHWIGVVEGAEQEFARNEDARISEISVHNLLLAAGNLQDVCKKYIIYEDDSKLEDVGMELVKFFSAWVPLAIAVFDSLQDAIDVNVEKLSKRYEGIQYSNQGAISRADKE